MHHFIKQSTEITLSLVLASDRERFFYLQQNAEINRYIRIPQPDSEVEVFFQALVSPWTKKDNAWHGFALRLPNKSELSGLIFYRYRDKKHEIVEIGWKLHPQISGQGLATDAAQLLMEYLKESISVHKFFAHCDAENRASERIMQKIGMQKEGLFKSNFKIGDEWCDELVYGLVV